MDIRNNKVLMHIAQGVYFGYPTEDITEFVFRTLKEVSFQQNTLFEGTGYMCYFGDGGKEYYVEKINRERYCKSPFPPVEVGLYENLLEEIEIQRDEINTLLTSEPYFQYKVITIMRAVMAKLKESALETKIKKE